MPGSQNGLDFWQFSLKIDGLLNVSTSMCDNSVLVSENTWKFQILKYPSNLMFQSSVRELLRKWS